jgi:hypothetical protein
MLTADVAYAAGIAGFLAIARPSGGLKAASSESTTGTAVQ